MHGTKEAVVAGPAEQTIVSHNAPERAVVAGGVASTCATCEITIHTLATEPPGDCPFCHGGLGRATYTPPPPTDEVEGVTNDSVVADMKRVSFGRVIALSIVGIVLLTLAANFKVSNLMYFWYQPWVNFYSITVGVFIVSRFLLAGFYRPPTDVGYEPTVTVCVACMNEEGSIEKTIGRAYNEGYPKEKLEVVVVNDGSTDNTLPEMMRAQARHPRTVVVDFHDNKGKRHGMAAGALMSAAEILVYVDSDSFLMPGAIRKVVQGLADPTVGAVSGHTDVENVYVNTLTRMQHVRYYVSYKVMKGAEHIFGAVSCCPGCFSAYRKAAVLPILHEWLHQWFLGNYATFGDDRSLTNYILREGQRVLYDDEAVATTIVPEKWTQYINQQCRWKRSWIREMLFAGRHMWRQHPIAAISWYAMTLLPLIAPLVMFHALILSPLMTQQPATFYIVGVLVVTLLWGLYFLEKTGRRYWWTIFVFMMTYALFFSWQGFYALITCYKTRWGTRG